MKRCLTWGDHMGNNYRHSRFAENLNVAQFETTGQYHIPVLQPCEFIPCEFVGFNYAKTAKNREAKGVHFFIDDYQFERVWRMPETYIDMLSQFQMVMTPDFSLYTDYPKAIQIYNHYRKQWLGAYWQAMGLNVIPTIAWSDDESFDWCFDGVPKHAVVAVSSVGTQDNQKSKELFLNGWKQMLERLEPETVIFYGQVPQECKADIVRVKAFSEKFREGKVNGW